MDVKKEQVAGYYDELWAELDKQNKAGINSRHRYILNELLNAGLKRNSTVLEVGCGVGSLTSFIANKISSGMILGADISPASIEYAKKKYQDRKNINFVHSDMSDFSSDKKFDFVVLPDVLEHIPKENHFALFQTLSKVIHDNSVVFVNIPNPPFLEWFHKYQPQDLQIIDQPLPTNELLKNIYPHKLKLHSLKTYSLYYNVDDYQVMVFKPDVAFQNIIKKDKTKVLLNGIKLRLKLLFK
jgi:trans-aconitate 2-methyltransferase